MNKINLIAVLCFGLFIASCKDKTNTTIPWGPDPEPVEFPKIENKVFGYKDDVSFIIPFYAHGEWEEKQQLFPWQHVSVSQIGDNKCNIKFYSDDLDLNQLFNGELTGVLPSLCYLNIKNEVTVPLDIYAYNPKLDTYTLEGEMEIENVTLKMWKSRLSKEGFSSYYDWTWSENPTFYKLNGIYLDSRDHIIKFKLKLPVMSDDLKFDVYQIINKWESTAYPSELKDKVPSTDFMQIILNTPFLDAKEYGMEDNINGKVSIVELFEKIDLSFPYFGDKSLISFNVGSFPYYTFSFTDIIESDADNLEGTFKLYADPYKVLWGTVKKNVNPSYEAGPKALDLLYANILLEISPANIDGILMNYKFKENTGYADYEKSFENSISDKAISIKFIKGLLLPLLKNDDNKMALITSLRNNELLGENADILITMVENMENLIENTSDAVVSLSYN